MHTHRKSIFFDQELLSMPDELDGVQCLRRECSLHRLQRKHTRRAHSAARRHCGANSHCCTRGTEDWSLQI